MTKQELLTGQHTSMYTLIQDQIALDMVAGDHHLFVGKESYKDEHILWLDNETYNRLIADGFDITPTGKHDWKISW